jgi:restriction system protein
MTIPDYQSLMLPLLQFAADGREHTKREALEQLGRQLGLTASELSTLLPSGRQGLFDNRVAWARSYLKHAGLLDAPRRGVFVITERGRQLLAEGLSRIDNRVLARYPEFLDFTSGANRRRNEDAVDVVARPDERESDLTPDEWIRAGHKKLRETLGAELLQRIGKASPRFFEGLVVDLLVAMGYGGSHEDAARVVGQSGDGGIDGIIKQDRLGLDNIYVQAKRWQPGSTVGRPDVQQFAGALHGRKASKGVFITTATFSREAIEYARGVQTAIVLIDGKELAELMLDYGIGVSLQETIRLQRVDEDYFVEE